MFTTIYVGWPSSEQRPRGPNLKGPGAGSQVAGMGHFSRHV